MIERRNWFEIKEYLDFHLRILQHDEKTIKRKRSYLRHLLEWADDVLFADAYQIDIPYSTYLLTARNDGKNIRLSPTSMRRACAEARQFLTWAQKFHKDRYQYIPDWWIPSIRPGRSVSTQSNLIEREVYTLEEVRKLIALPHPTLIQTRDRSALAFLFLSGMRISAFVTLPISCVDIKERSVWQLPNKGVRTKNHKAARTYLFEIADLLAIVQAWDEKVRAELPENALWYASLNWSGDLFTGAARTGMNRPSSFADGLREMCNQAGITYRSPHKLRHGHALYALHQARNIAELKAVSQNLMHNSLTTTDAIYGQMLQEEVRHVIATLGKRGQGGTISRKTPPPPEDNDLAVILPQLAQAYLQAPELFKNMLESQKNSISLI